MDSSQNSTKAEMFNKSREMISGLIINDPQAQKRFLSQDGIYKVLGKVLFSDLTPEYIRAEYREGGNNDIVLSFVAEMYIKGCFSRAQLEKLNATYDASLYSYARQCAIHHLQDKIRAYNSSIRSRLVTDVEQRDNTDKRDAFEKATSKMAVEDPMRQFENRDLLIHIVDAAKLNSFQKHIISRLLDGYEPEEILNEYEQKHKQKLTMNYYYSQKSKAISALKEAAVGYSWR